MLIDSHCHLDHEQLNDGIDGIIERAKTAGVDKLVTICTSLEEWGKVRSIVEKYENVYAGVGVHPHKAGECGLQNPQTLYEIALHPKVVGIGETGLDYHYDLAPRQEQMVSFQKHIDISRQTGLPLIVHARDADRDICNVLEDETHQWKEQAIEG